MKKGLVILALVAAVAVGAYYFFFAKSDVCKNVIPEDAKAVLVFDAGELVKQLDFSFSDILELIKQGDDEKEDVGIDFLSPMYGFVSSDNYLCGVFALSDAEEFEEAISDEDIKVESQRGFKWVYSNEVLACFDSKKALVLGPVSKGESDGMRGKVAEWMNQGSHKVPMLSSIEDEDGILRLRSTLGVIPEKYKSQFATMYKNVDLNSVFFNLAFNMKEKALVLSSEMDSEDEEYTKLLSEWTGYSHPIQSDRLQTPYEKPLAFVVLNMNGEEMCNKLSSMTPYFGMMLGQMNVFCNAGMMLQAIDGNVTVAIDDISENMPHFYVTAQVKNKDFMNGAEKWGDGLAAMGVQCRQVEGDNYSLNINDIPVFLGVRDDLLYFASDYNVAKGDKFSSLEDGASLKSLAKGKLSYFSLDIDKLKNSPLVKSALDGKNEILKEVLNYLDRLNVSTGENRNVEIELTTKQKLSDIIKANLKK